MNEPQTTEQIPIEEIPERKTYARWVGVVMAWLVPGSVQFLAGRRLTGIAWYFGLLFGVLLCITLLAMPGTIFLGVFVVCTIIYMAFLIAMLVSSYRPVKHLGWSGWILFLLFWWFVSSNIGVLAARYGWKPYVAETFVITGMSMAPTLIGPSSEWSDAPVRGDRITVNKMSYRFGEPRRGDLVVYSALNNDDKPTLYVKRLAGLPGETVGIEDPFVLIDGERLLSPPIFQTISETVGYFQLGDMGSDGMGIELPIKLGPDEYFLLGDNQIGSKDSRIIGPIKRNDIIGKAIRIYWPLNRFGDLK